MLFLINSIKEMCLFTDQSFPCNDSNAGGTNVKWVRLQEVEIKSSGAHKKIDRLFSIIQPGDIAQGALGDCWLLAALATLAERPHLLQNCFKTRSFNPRGKYTLRLYDAKAKAWKNITIDDYIPVNANNVPLYTGATSNEMWPLLIEKAFAKMRGGYKALEGGLPLDAMQTITGFSGERFSIDANEDSKVFHKMRKMYDAGCVLACGSIGKDNTREEGRDKVQGSVVGGHAYSVLGIYEPMLSTEKVRLLKLRNPWGSFEWKGKWSDKCENWTKYLGIALEIGKPPDVDDGIFYMEWSDFIKLFDLVDALFPNVSVSELHITIREESGILGPFIGCLYGCAGYWCLCKGWYALAFAKSSQQLKKEIDLTYKV